VNALDEHLVDRVDVPSKFKYIVEIISNPSNRDLYNFNTYPIYYIHRLLVDTIFISEGTFIYNVKMSLMK